MLARAQLARAEPANEAKGAALEIRALHKSYGHFDAVKGIDLTVHPGEFLTFLGPSGSGKTTTLNIIAGFEAPTGGEVLLDGRPLANTPPYRRDIGMVFQNYALFPHLTVEENVAFPLSVRRLDRAAIAQKVAHALDMVQLGHLGGRHPAQLSGGQQQRVALARALVFNPRLVLMDEPLGALDKKLRDHMQVELMRLHRLLGVTVIYVTHDQGEALTMSNRIGVFQDGQLVQVDTPDAIYRSPATLFVSDFVGENNCFDGTVEGQDEATCTVRLEGGLRIRSRRGDPGSGEAVRITVRPEDIDIRPADASPTDMGGPDGNRFAGRVRERIYFGDHQRLVVGLDGGVTIMVKAPPSLSLPSEAAVELTWPAAACNTFRLSS